MNGSTYLLASGAPSTVTSAQGDSGSNPQVTLNSANVGIPSNSTVSSTQLSTSESGQGGITVLKPVTSSGGNVISVIMTSQQSGVISSTVTDAKNFSGEDGGKSYTIVSTPSSSGTLTSSGQPLSFSFVNTGNISSTNAANSTIMFQQVNQSSGQMVQQGGNSGVKSTASGKPGEFMLPYFTNTLQSSGSKLL